LGGRIKWDPATRYGWQATGTHCHGKSPEKKLNFEKEGSGRERGGEKRGSVVTFCKEKTLATPKIQNNFEIRRERQRRRRALALWHRLTVVYANAKSKREPISREDENKTPRGRLANGLKLTGANYPKITRAYKKSFLRLNQNLAGEGEASAERGEEKEERLA